jgi:glycosyltransferase involved in cell wall biosynthesis
VSHAGDLTDQSSRIFYSIVVCTKNRPREIENFLHNLRNQESDFLQDVIIVDGSSEVSTFNATERNYENNSPYTDIVYLRTTGGKPTALNIALRKLEALSVYLDAIVFLDDDITFQLEDLEKGIRYIKRKDLCGLSPIIINEGDICFRKRSRNRIRLFQKDSGVLTRAGDNFWINDRNIIGEWQKTEWLPGGAAIFDWSKIKFLTFNEQLENPKLMGYALGDDVDFSIKASSKGELGCLQTIQVIHTSPPGSYRNPITIAMARGRWKAFLVTEYPNKFSKFSVIAAEIISASARALFKAKPVISWRCLAVFLREFFKYLKKES